MSLRKYLIFTICIISIIEVCIILSSLYFVSSGEKEIISKAQIAEFDRIHSLHSVYLASNININDEEILRNYIRRIAGENNINIYLEDTPIPIRVAPYRFNPDFILRKKYPIDHAGQYYGTIIFEKDIKPLLPIFYRHIFFLIIGQIAFVCICILVLYRWSIKKILIPFKDKLKTALVGEYVTDPESNKYIPDEFRNVLDVLTSYARDNHEKSQLEIVARINSQVAHDIRSPLAALNIATSDLKEIPEDQRLLIRSAVRRINDIANDRAAANLKLTQDASPDESCERLSIQLLPSLVDSLVSEKRVQYRQKIGIEIEVDLDASSYGLFARIKPAEFKRVLSNLIDNSVEAAVDGCRIVVSLYCDADKVRLKITDNGRGIPPDLLREILRFGGSYGKPGGSGLGLSYAKEAIKLWCGDLNITSAVEKGTTVEIMLPKIRPPEWFVPELSISNDLNIVILDDDDSIHQVWKNRLDSLRQEGRVEIFHFTDPNEFIDWQCQRNGSCSKYVYLFDHEFLGHSITGLDVIENLNIRDHAILVTSHYEDAAVRRRCEELGVRLIPKNLVGYVPIVLLPESSSLIATCEDRGARTSDRVLMIVNDEDFMRVSVKYALKDLKNVRIIEAAGVSDALKMFKEHSVDVVLADINLGEDRDGYDILREVRAQSKTTKFYMMSGMPKEDEWPKAQEMGADGYIQLPYESEELLNILN